MRTHGISPADRDGNIMDVWNYGFSPKRSEDEVSEGGDEGLQYIYIRIGMAPWSMLLNSH
jgi:hypothetical protein